MHQIGYHRHGVAIRVGYSQLVPGQRDRHGHDLGEPLRIRRRHGAVASVPAEVHERAARPILVSYHLRGHRLWCAALYFAYQRDYRPTHNR